MHVFDFEPFDRATGSGFRCVGRFGVQVCDDLRMYHWQLVQTPSGGYLSYPPAGASINKIVSVNRQFRDKITEYAVELMQGKHDRRAA